MTVNPGKGRSLAASTQSHFWVFFGSIWLGVGVPFVLLAGYFIVRERQLAATGRVVEAMVLTKDIGRSGDNVIRRRGYVQERSGRRGASAREVGPRRHAQHCRVHAEGEEGQDQLTTLAESTGGRYYGAQSGESLARALWIAAIEKFPYAIFDAAGKQVAKGEGGAPPVELEPGATRWEFELWR